MHYSLDLLVWRSLGEQHEATEELLERDALGGSSAGDKEPLGQHWGHAIAQHLVDKGTLRQPAAAHGRAALERLLDPF